MSRYLLFIGWLIVVVASCAISPDNGFKAKPNALGVMNEIVVITDDNIWESHVGDTIKDLFGSIYPITPRPEPLFDLRQYTVDNLGSQPLKKELRTYMIVANLADGDSKVAQFVKEDLGPERYERARSDDSFHTSIGRDKWAHGQILIYVFANSVDKLADAIGTSFEGISAKVNDHDKKQLYQTTYARGINKGLSAKVGTPHGINISIPAEYIIATEEPEVNGMIWLRKEIKDGTMSLVIRSYDYTTPDQVSKSSVKANYNAFGAKHVSSDVAGSYMVINDVDLPMLGYDRTVDGQYAKEFRGIWELENDFMGGPFLSYAMVHPDLGKMVQIDGFIFAPGRRKRDELQQLDLIARSVTWREEGE